MALKTGAENCNENRSKQSSQTAAILGGLMPIEHEGMLMGIMSDRFIAAFKGSSE